MVTRFLKKYLQFKQPSFFTTVLLCCLVIPAHAGSVPETAEPATSDTRPLHDFKAIALISLKNIPQLQRSRMEIELQHINEDDSRWSIAPTITLSSTYYFSESDSNISLNVGNNYKPWESYFSIKAQKLITSIVQLHHIQAISNSLYGLAEKLLEIIAYDQIDKEYGRMIRLYAKRFEYVDHRSDSPETIPLELEYERRANELALTEKKGNTVRRDTLVHHLRTHLNIPDSQLIDLNASETFVQILGSKEWDNILDRSRPEQSFRRKIFAVKMELQEKKILLAYAKYLPSFTVGLRSSDILNVSVDEEQDYFFYAGMSLTLWDANKRSRNITRQKKELSKMEFEKKEIKSDDELEWLKALRQLALKKSEYAIVQSAEKLKLLEIKRKQFEYDNGTAMLPALLNEKIALHRHRIRILEKKLELNKAALYLRHLSGRLLGDTVKISFDPKTHEQITTTDQ